MKPLLMYKDHDFDLKQDLLWQESTLVQDLELNTLFNAMSLGDEFIFQVVKLSILSGLGNSVNTILYRQNILRDCLLNASVIKNIYDITIEAIEGEKKNWLFTKRFPSSNLHRAIDVLQLFFDLLKILRTISDEHATKFTSEGLVRMFAMLKNELNDEYFDAIENHLKELKFRNGVLISGKLGKGNKGTNYVLRKGVDIQRSWIKGIFTPKSPYTYRVDPSDEIGAQALGELNDRGINLVANVLSQSTDHILSFFYLLKAELAFYLGCLNLHNALSQKLAPVSFPIPMPADQHLFSFKGLYDTCLFLSMNERVVGNDVNADGKNLVIITGANQGGKSTFLRSIGVSLLMMQAGMFVSADFFTSSICVNLFTHYKREEDTTMESGKLDEELSRMNDIVKKITPNSILLFNESFAATNELEASELARQIVSGLLEKNMHTFFVTHLSEFSHTFFINRQESYLFLRAERHEDGTRTFKLIEGEPLQTSYGEDLYKIVFDAGSDS